MRFNNFFMEYKLGLKKIGSFISWNKLPFYRKFFIFLLSIASVFYVIFIILAVSKKQINATWFLDGSVIFTIILTAIVAIFNFIDSMKNFRSRMLQDHYNPNSKDRMNMLIDLLEQYGIKLNTVDSFDRVNLLIQQAEESKTINNPFLNFKKYIKLLGAAIIPAVAYVANKIAEQLSIHDLLIIVIGCGMILAITAVIIFALQPVIMKIVYPDNDKYEELIYDLKQLKIFYCNSDE